MRESDTSNATNTPTLGQDGARPVFVFTKEAWIAGIAGLPEKDPDAQARVLASALR